MARADGRRANDLRPVRVKRGFTSHAPGSVLIECGQTRVLCTAIWQAGVPRWREGKGSGWVTAEYDMLPSAVGDRKPRNRLRVDGRTQEIQRLIGRCLRAVIDLDALGENSILIDCDVLQADGGTRAASVTGAYIAVCDAVRYALSHKQVSRSPVLDSVAAVSVGRVGGRLLVDLDHAEDTAADVDLNVAMTGAGGFVEIQGTGERASFSRDELDRMLRAADGGIRRLIDEQDRALRRRR
ncbi:MAG: ribonuclease PH [Phycisphaerales bacterium]|nr:MAG: ribonuclease PH [Phycisphaerales bacterium]